MPSSFRLLFVLLAGFAISHSATAAEKEFRGFTEISTQTGCPDSDVLGRDLLTRFLRANVADNGTSTHLGLFGHSFAQGYSIDGVYTAAYKDASMTHVGSRFGENDYPISIRRISQTPATITESTRTINMQLQIKGYDWMPTCIATLSVVLTADF